METAKEKPKIALVRRPQDADNSASWLRFKKALGTLGEVEESETETPLSLESLNDFQTKFEHVFMDLSLADNKALLAFEGSRLTLLRKDSFSWNSPQVRDNYQEVLLKYPCFLIEDVSASDLVRLMHCFLFPKRQSGVSQLMEKGSVILGEKLFDLASVGQLNDKIASYLGQLDGFQLKDKIPQVRQLLTPLLFECNQQSKLSGTPYPAIDFQLSASVEKLAIHLRFPKGNLKIEDLCKKVVAGENYLWQSLWLNSDILFIIDHEMHNEIEINVLLTKSKGNSTASFRSFIWKRQEKGPKKESLLTSPANYVFQLISEIKSKDLSSSLNHQANPDEIPKDLNLDALPEIVVQKISDLEKERSFLRDSDSKKDLILKDLKSKFLETNKELNQKQVELNRLLKANDHQQQSFKAKLEELENKISKNQQAASLAAAAPKDAPSLSSLQESVAKLEAGLRVAENEKAGLLEKITLEQKRLAAQEQKYAQLHKDSAGKEKEIQELKAALLKAQKESPEGKKQGNGATAGAGANEIVTKLKETEARETALKQELRKALFKLESADKNTKAIQNEAAEKAKLMEQKLQGAKTKEVELLKKIEDLSAALKKAAKAA